MITSIHRNIEEAVHLLRAGELVAIPTETVYGLAANALDTEAVLRIFSTKQRPHFNPLIVHVGKKHNLKAYATQIPKALLQLCEAFWPGPLTILVSKQPVIHDLVTAGSQLVALRMPNHALTMELLDLIDFPLAAPSANLFGSISPTTANHVAEQLDGLIPLILDGGACGVGVESTIVKEENGRIHILRSGGITPEDILEVTGKPAILVKGHSENPEAPGMLKSHYAPNTPLVTGNLPELLQQYAGKKVAILDFGAQVDGTQVHCRVDLSATRSESEAARKLFDLLRILDKSGADVILAPRLPDTGLGYAINDRLHRASMHS